LKASCWRTSVRPSPNTEKPRVRTRMRPGLLGSLRVGNCQLPSSVSATTTKRNRDTWHFCANCRHWPKSNYVSSKENLSRARCATSVEINARTKTANSGSHGRQGDLIFLSGRRLPNLSAEIASGLMDFAALMHLRRTNSFVNRHESYRE